MIKSVPSPAPSQDNTSFSPCFAIWGLDAPTRLAGALRVLLALTNTENLLHFCMEWRVYRAAWEARVRELADDAEEREMGITETAMVTLAEGLPGAAGGTTPRTEGGGGGEKATFSAGRTPADAENVAAAAALADDTVTEAPMRGNPLFDPAGRVATLVTTSATL